MKINEVKADLNVLNKFIMSLTGVNGMSVKVGILAGKNSRSDGNKETNASIGIKHEFGRMSSRPRIRQRSFLKMPLETKSDELTKTVMGYAVEELAAGTPETLLAKIGITAEGIIHQAFDTGGFGKWKALRPMTIEKKGHDRILIETMQLQRSITSEVVKGENK